MSLTRGCAVTFAAGAGRNLALAVGAASNLAMPGVDVVHVPPLAHAGTSSIFCQGQLRSAVVLTTEHAAASQAESQSSSSISRP
jgi:hypothetical protein